MERSSDDTYTTEEALKALTSLGAPEISVQDFERLHSGALGKLLDFVIAHMQGRQRVSSARAGIQKRRDEVGADPRAAKGFPKDELMENLRRASSRLNAAQKSVEVYQDELYVRQAALRKTQREMEKVTSDLDAKHRSLALLTSLTEVEDERTERLRRAEESCNMLCARLSKVPKRTPPLPAKPNSPTSTSPSRKSHTALTLHNLHAYHVHLNELLQSSPEAINARSTRYKTLLPSSGRGGASLAAESAELYQVVTTKQARLQRLSDTSLGRIVACQKLAGVTHDFTTLAAPAHAASLRAGAADGLGRVQKIRDVLGLPLDAGMAIRDDDLLPALAALLKIHGRPSVEAVLRELCEATHPTPTLGLLPAPPPTEGAALSAHHSRTVAHNARALKLLARKAEKAEYGIRILEDMQGSIARDVRAVRDVRASKDARKEGLNWKERGTGEVPDARRTEMGQKGSHRRVGRK